MKSVFLALAIFSGVASAQECKILVSAKAVNNYQTRGQAEKVCQQYGNSQIECNVYKTSDSSWESRIDFSDVFAGADDSFKLARTEAYRKYFGWLDSKKIYALPNAFQVKFDCKPY